MRLGSGKMQAKQHFRIFYHFCNKTKKPLSFNLSTQSEVSSSGSYSISLYPELAGTKAIKSFFNGKRTKDRVKIVASVPSNYTISGILDGETDIDNSFVAFMGENTGTQLCKITEVISHDFNITTDFSHRIGLLSEIKGDYGQDYNYIIQNTNLSPSRIVITANARGGLATFPYKIDNTIEEKSSLPVKKDCVITDRVLKPGQKITLSTIPVGGCNYPIVLSVKWK